MVDASAWVKFCRQELQDKVRPPYITERFSEQEHQICESFSQDLRAVLSLLEEKELTLQKARRYICLRSILEVWLFIHIPATIALIAALTAHIISVFFFW